MKDWQANLVLGAMFFGVIAVVLGIGYLGEKFMCQAKWSSMENSYGFFSGCQVKSAQGWVPAESYKVIN